MNSRWAYLSCVSAIALMPAVALAAEDTSGGELSEVIVTAQKREQRLIDVPMAVSVLGGEELAQRGIQSVQDLSFAVPGLTMREDGPGSYTIFLRGLANQSGSGALVSQYLDEVPLSLSGYDQLSPVALDLQRVEVLKGPQGTLYGQGSAGGTIRYITNRPKLDRVEGNVEGTVYGVGHGEMGGRALGVINVPLVKDVLALRLAGSIEDGGGWIDQPEAGISNGNGTKLINVRGKLLWAPTERLEAEAMIQLHRADTKLGLGFEEPDRTVDIGPDRSKVLLPKQFDFTIYNLEVRYDLGFADLVSATSYIDHDHQYPFTYIPRPGNFSAGFVEGNDDRFLEADQFSQEIRLSSSGKPLEWTVGAFFRDADRELIVDYEYLYAPAGDIAAGGGTLYDNLYYRDRSSSKSYSLFADAAYHFNDRLTAGAGVRYFHDKQTSLIEYALGTGAPQKASFESVDPRVYVSYRYAAHANLYASIAKGFRSGGFNSAPFQPYDPEKIFTYELGTKGSLAGGALQFELVGFYTQYKDMVRRRLVQVNGAFLSESSNIGEVEVKGVEFGAAWRPMPALTLTATGAYVDSEITDTDAGDVVNVPGDRTDYTPKLSYALGAKYDFDWAPEVPGFVRVDFEHRDAVTYIDRSSFLASVLPQKSDSVDLLSARIGAQLEKVSVEVFATNITDENRSIDPYQGWANANRTRPRMIGMKVGYAF